VEGAHALVPVERIERSILLIRGRRVILDSDLALLFGVSTRDLNKAVSRNRVRFPDDFMFQLTKEEFGNLKFQFGTSSWGGTRKVPRAFTEHGAIMTATTLNSPRAVQASVYVVRAFVKLKAMLTEHRELAAKVAELERKFATHDMAIRDIVDAIKRLAVLPPPEPERPRIGFRVKEAGAPYRRRRARS